ncbi:murein transglycosylase [Skermanella stibiiresistens SB22]|uniref:Murein transglycosylase n=1 Tax=Skermanella stibiiresistens SB22 TaxID=1385369 RepID=W9H593_9PROT|nr:transglycosylase SLT domain-containing protein [Skermanella stibiiresistens]EWY41199.1 murein transglycosylase [Skermanella stibiiresistens SB22]
MKVIRQSLFIIGLCVGPVHSYAAEPDRTVLALETFAKSGSTRAQFELGRRFESGIGTKLDYTKAFNLYCQAAAKRHPEASYRLARLYLSGKGAPRDTVMAASWIKRAIELGETEARELLPQVKSVKQVQEPGCFVPGVRGAGHLPPPAKIEKMVRQMAPDFSLDPDFVLAIMQIESGYRADAVSPRNAQGLMQLIPDTADRFGVKDPFDPQDNIRGGMRYLRWLMAYFRGDVTLVAAAYNAGEGAVERYRGVPPYRETEAYVLKLKGVYPRKRHPFEPSVAKASDAFASAEVAELE